MISFFPSVMPVELAMAVKHAGVEGLSKRA